MADAVGSGGGWGGGGRKGGAVRVRRLKDLEKVLAFKCSVGL